MNLLADPEAQFENHMFPVSVVGQGGWELPNWVQGYEKHWRDKGKIAQDDADEATAREADLRARDARAFGEHLKGITEQYQVSYIELDRDLEIDRCATSSPRSTAVGFASTFSIWSTRC